MKLFSSLVHTAEEIVRTERTDLETRRRDERLRHAMRSNWTEIPRNRLEFSRYYITDTGTNELFLVHHGEIDGPCPVAAYFVNDEGDPVFLEHHPHARTVEALAAKREKAAQAREARIKPRVRR